MKLRSIVTDVLGACSAGIAVVALVCACVCAVPLPARARPMNCIDDPMDGLIPDVSCYQHAGPPARVEPIPHHWVAIALSTKTFWYGYADGYLQEADAERAAVASCRKHAADCRLALSGRDMCLALAFGDNGVWSAGYSIARPVARTNALARCRDEKGRACSVSISPCAWEPASLPKLDTLY